MLILLPAFPAFALTYDELLQKAADYVVSEEYDKAFACFDLAIKSEPDNAIAYIKAGLLHLERSKLSDARESIEKALAVDATSSDAWVAKCRIEISAEDVSSYKQRFIIGFRGNDFILSRKSFFTYSQL